MILPGSAIAAAVVLVTGGSAKSRSPSAQTVHPGTANEAATQHDPSR